MMYVYDWPLQKSWAHYQTINFIDHSNEQERDLLELVIKHFLKGDLDGEIAKKVLIQADTL